jgi:outer membrane protein assembly factor BamB
MKNLILLILLAGLLSCKPGKSNKPLPASAEKYKLELVWQSDTLLRTPESVLLDRDRNILYVSNVNLNPWEKDGNGFISQLDKSGNIIILKWIEGLNGPKGMGISGKSLYIADIDELVEANIETGKIIRKIKLDGKPDLNDVTVGGDDKVYVSGSGSNTVYQLKDSTLVAIFKGNDGERFNGIYRESERMLLITSAGSQFKEIIPETGLMKVISDNIGQGDGITPVGDGGYITTSWKGAVYYISSDGVPAKLLDTEAIQENAADPDFDTKEQVLYIPTFFKNRVKAYRLENRNLQ